MEQTICWLMQLASLRRLAGQGEVLWMVESGSEAKGNAAAHLSDHFKPAKIKSDDRTAIKLLKWYLPSLHLSAFRWHVSPLHRSKTKVLSAGLFWSNRGKASINWTHAETLSKTAFKENMLRHVKLSKLQQFKRFLMSPALAPMPMTLLESSQGPSASTVLARCHRRFGRTSTWSSKLLYHH